MLHELAHGLVADALGDPTPRRMGRLTLDPLAHIDWIGLIMLVLFRFGWAKPVMVDPRNFKNPRLGMLWVALAGPAMNVLLAFVALLLQPLLGLPYGSTGWTIVYLIFLYNVFFAIFNILPIPPLDGSKIIAAFGGEAERLVHMIEPFGWVILLVAVYSGFINPLLNAMAGGLAGVLQLLAMHMGVGA
ncbi:MAG TPA: site-2 protease family protein [Bacillota bacterium]|nr:site-2 protease family protein [Bacillota bacterium]